MVETHLPLLIELSSVGLLQDLYFLVFPQFVSDPFLQNVLDKVFSIHTLIDLFSPFLFLSKFLLLFDAQLREQMQRIQIRSIKIDDLIIPLAHNSVDESEVLLVVCHQINHGVSDQHASTVPFGCSFQTRRHVDVRSQITGVDFVLGANGTFNCPSEMKSKAHLHPQIVGNPLLE